jgi:hypothetical protein
MKKRLSQSYRQALDPAQPFSHSQLQALSNLAPEDLYAFRQDWPAAPAERRRQIARALARLNEDSPDLYFRDVFMLLLDDPDEIVRAAAIDGLGDDESYDFLERLLSLAVEEPVPDLRCQIILALGRFLYRIETTDLLADYRERLLQLLLDAHGDTALPLDARRRALESAAYAAASASVEEAIARAYAAPDPEMRASALHAMGHHMAARWRPHVERELASPDPEMRYEAAHACGEMADREMLPHLAPLLDDDDHEVAREAIWALGEIGGQQARRLLQRCLQHEAEDLRAAAREALHTIDFYEDPGSVF